MATAGEPNDEDDEPNDIDREISELRSAKKEIFEIIKPFTDERYDTIRDAILTCARKPT